MDCTQQYNLNVSAFVDFTIWTVSAFLHISVQGRVNVVFVYSEAWKFVAEM
jgi:hypothetical protein